MRSFVWMVLGLYVVASQLDRVQADPAFFCQNIANLDLKRFGDFDFYAACDGQCDCSFIELICLVRTPQADYITLNSASLAYSQSCPQTECICNTDELW